MYKKLRDGIKEKISSLSQKQTSRNAESSFLGAAVETYQKAAVACSVDFLPGFSLVALAQWKGF